MHRIGAIGAMLVLGAAAAPALAQGDESCRYGERRYASGMVICQAGQVQTCVGGEWQTTGAFCDGGRNGAYVGTEALEPGDVDHTEGPRVPVQNAPMGDDDGD
jgi:hypothetical protein